MIPACKPRFRKPLDPLDEPNKYYDPFIEREGKAYSGADR